MLAVLLGLMLAPAPATGGWAAEVQEMIAAERAFSLRSQQEGIRAAFLAYFGDEAVIFDPGPVPGRPVYEALPAAGKSFLAWEPEFADLAASCELGVSVGRWELRRDRLDGDKAIFGHYVSIWRNTPASGWKVVVDAGGGTHARPEGAVARVETGTVSGPLRDPLSAAGRAPLLADLRSADARFWSVVRERGLAAGLDETAMDGLRYFRENDYPVIGKARSLALLEAGSAEWTANGAGAAISLAGDLGYTYGASRRVAPHGQGGGATADEGGYLLVWRRPAAGPWRILLFTTRHAPAKG